MKTAVKIILATALAMLGYTANAQLTINGVDTSLKMTKEEVIAKFGEPTDYRYNDSENGFDIWYHYDDSFLVFKDNHLIQFTIKDNRFVVKLKDLDTGVTVGDKFYVLDPLKPEPMDWFGEGWYRIFIYDEAVRFLVEDGIIQSIVFSERL